MLLQPLTSVQCLDLRVTIPLDLTKLFHSNRDKFLQMYGNPEVAFFRTWEISRILKTSKGSKEKGHKVTECPEQDGIQDCSPGRQ